MGNQEALAAERTQGVETTGSAFKQLTALTPLEIEYCGREGSTSDPQYCSIMGPIPALNRWGVIADTLNCDYCISPDEQREWSEKLVHRHNVHEAMLAALKSAVGHIEHMAAFFGGKGLGYSFESLGEDMPGIRAAIALASGASQR